MRKSFLLGVTLALAALLAGRAEAAVLPLNGTLSVDFGFFGVTLSGTGTGTSNGAFDLAAVPAGVISQTSDLSVPIQPTQLGLSKLTIMASPTAPVVNFAGSFGPGGIMGNNAVANLFFTNGGFAGAVPLAYVGGGPILGCEFVCPPWTIIGVEWTNLGVSAGNVTKTTMVMGSPAGIPVTITATAFDKRTAGGAGTVQLVAPTMMKLYGGGLGSLPLVGTLTLQFVPEPGTLLPVGSGVVVLVAANRRSARRGEGATASARS